MSYLEQKRLPPMLEARLHLFLGIFEGRADSVGRKIQWAKEKYYKQFCHRRGAFGTEICGPAFDIACNIRSDIFGARKPIRSAF